ncbi:molybdopterin-binding protein, partial [Fusobacterium ulcerans]
ELGDKGIHENDAALVLGKLGKGKNIRLADEIKEGKINFYAQEDGVLKVDTEKLLELNMLGEISFATLPDNIPVKKGDLVAGARVIPLVIDKEKMEKAESIIQTPILNVNSYRKYKVGMVTTGNEVFFGRIEDKFGKIVTDKLKEFDCEVIAQLLSQDSKDMIKRKAQELLDMGAEMLIFTGGMSVDPDDVTPSAIIELGGELVSYGSPVLPGSMFLLSYLGDVPVMGLPGCVMFAKRTIFDLVLPRILSEEKLTTRDIMMYGNGGLCQSCEVCHYPNCTFGK